MWGVFCKIMLVPHNTVMNMDSVMFDLYELFVSLTPTSLVKSFRGKNLEEEEQFKKCKWRLCQLGKKTVLIMWCWDNENSQVLRPNPSQELLTTHLSSD